MTILFWIIFILAILVFGGLVLAKIPQVVQTPIVRKIKKGSEENPWHYFLTKVKIYIRKFWHFVLEAKDLHPPVNLARQMDKIKHVFRIKVRKSEDEPHWIPEATEKAPEPAVAVKKIEETEIEKSAEDLYLADIKKDPTDVSAYEGLGRMYLQEKNYAEAVEIFEFLTTNRPEKDVYWSNLGLCLYSIKEHQKAILAYEKALKINSKVPIRWVNMAFCFEAIDEPIKAIKAVSQALQLDRRNVNYLMFLSSIYLRIENFVRAEEVLEQVLEIEPTNKAARQRLMKLKI
jgi:tetratricopeptide (TPR) repeat protein